jgi:hypothetical protein
LTNNEKLKLVEQTAEERLKESIKNDRIIYLLNQIGAKLQYLITVSQKIITHHK